jgi:hypothetical protein
LNKRNEKQQKKQRREGEDDDWLPSLPEFKRGGSTISQQLAKNLYLSSQKNFIRKGQEAIVTVMLERTLTKRRILEIYLNVIEWGDGVLWSRSRGPTLFSQTSVGVGRQRGRVSVSDDS